MIATQQELLAAEFVAEQIRSYMASGLERAFLLTRVQADLDQAYGSDLDLDRVLALSAGFEAPVGTENAYDAEAEASALETGIDIDGLNEYYERGGTEFEFTVELARTGGVWGGGGLFYGVGGLRPEGKLAALADSFTNASYYLDTLAWSASVASGSIGIAYGVDSLLKAQAAGDSEAVSNAIGDISGSVIGLSFGVHGLVSTAVNVIAGQVASSANAAALSFSGVFGAVNVTASGTKFATGLAVGSFSAASGPAIAAGALIAGVGIVLAVANVAYTIYSFTRTVDEWQKREANGESITDAEKGLAGTAFALNLVAGGVYVAAGVVSSIFPPVGAILTAIGAILGGLAAILDLIKTKEIEPPTELNGTEGDDEIYVFQPSVKTINLGGGDDTLHVQVLPNGSSLVNIANGGEGNDTLNLSALRQINHAYSVNTVLNDANLPQPIFVTTDRFYAGPQGYTLINFENVIGSQGRDYIDLEALNSTSTYSGNTFAAGGLGNDTVSGSSGNDSIYGNEGNDTLLGLVGDDTIVGGAGNDTIFGDSFGSPGDSSATNSDVIIATQENDYVEAGYGDDVVIIGANHAAFNVIDHVWQRGRGTLYGDFAGQGGVAGNDTLVIQDNYGFDLDTVAGLAAYSLKLTGNARVAASVNLEQNFAKVIVNGAEIANYTIKEFENVIGTSGADTIYGNSGDNYIDGGEGRDSLYGGGGDDYFTVSVGAGEIDGGTGFDVVDFSNATNTRTVSGNNVVTTDITYGLNVNLAIGSFTGSVTTAAGTAAYLSGRLSGIEAVFGSNGNDSITGTDSNDILVGGKGADTIRGGDLNDRLGGGSGADSLDGGTGIDTVDYTLDAGDADGYGDGVGFAINLATGRTTKANDSATGEDTLTGIENVVGSDAADSITGSSENNQLQGGKGADTILGGAGNDVLSGGAGVDSLDGGADIDTISYAIDAGDAASTREGRGVHILLADGTTQSRLHGDVIDRFSNIENATGSDGNDYIAGTSGVNVLVSLDGTDDIDGHGGDDVLVGGNGNDTLRGGADNDLISGGDGLDSIDGGSGIDTLDYSLDAGDADGHLGNGYNVDLSGGTTTILNVGGTEDTFTGIENVTGSKVGDIILGNGSANVLNGGAGHDLIEGGGGLDTLLGDAGNDTIVGFIDADTVDGGTGDDEVDTYEGNDRVFGQDGNDTLRAGSGDDTVVGGNGADLIEGGENNDVLLGDASDLVDSLSVDTIHGGSGNDTILGGGGADVLNGDAGDDILVASLAQLDTINGGADRDSVYFGLNEAAPVNGVQVDLRAGTIRNLTSSNVLGAATGAGSISGVEAVFGTDLADFIGGADQTQGDEFLHGGGGGDHIEGRDGVDYLSGEAGNDTLNGGAGNDVLAGGSGVDVLIGGLGNDTLVGAEDYDVVSYDDAHVGTDPALVQVRVDLAAGTGQIFNRATPSGAWVQVDNDAIYEVEDVIGSIGADIITGDTLANTLTGRSGNDTLAGGAGNDELSGGEGLDSLDGGAGFDVVNYQLDSADRNALNGTGYDIDLAQGVTRWLSNGATLDTLSSIEGARGTDRADRITGDGGANLLVGGAGNDTILGGAGNDTLAGGAGGDSLDGGADSDTITYAVDAGDAASNNSGYGVHILLDAGTTQSRGSGNVIDRFSNIENAVGTESNDHIEGTSGANRLTGGAGNDQIFGLGGDDVLDGGLGVDTITGGTGSDTLVFFAATGGNSVSNSAAAPTVFTVRDANGATIATTTATEVENLIGLDGNDSLHGNTADNFILGGRGDDTLRGGAGNDQLVGGLGSNILDGGADHDTANFVDIRTVAGSEVNTVVDLTAGTAITRERAEGQANFTIIANDQLVSIESVTTGDGNDGVTGTSEGNILTTGAGDDRIIAGGGNDVITAGSGSNQIDGGTGSDTANYAEILGVSGGTLTVDLTAGTAVADDPAGYNVAVDFLTQVENVTGAGTGSNHLTGDGGANILVGGTLVDTLFGGADNDSLSGGGGLDHLDGGEGFDTAILSSGHNYTIDLRQTTYATTDASGTVIAGAVGTLSGIENVTLGDGLHRVIGTDTANRIETGAGNDIIQGLDGDDTILGGAGTDQLDAGAGNDLVVGGIGNDILTGGLGTDALGYGDGFNADLLEHYFQNGASLIDKYRVTVGATGGTVEILGANGQALETDQFQGFETYVGTGLGNVLNFTAATAFTASGSRSLNRRDSVSYAALTAIAGILVNLTTTRASAVEADGTIHQQVLIDYEDVVGSSGNDLIVGSAQANHLQGGAGDDQIEGVFGLALEADGTYSARDTIDGGAGNDTAGFRTATSGVNVSLAAGTATGGAKAQISGIENIDGSDQNDTLAGDSGVNLLYGNDGDDLFLGSLGLDTLDGGAGFDTVDYSAAADGRRVDLAAGTAATASGQSLGILRNIEGVIGSAFADTLAGDAGANRLEGRGGADSLAGGGGNDTLVGGHGHDVISGDDNDDILSGGWGQDTLHGGAGIDTLSYLIDSEDADGYGDGNGFAINLLTGQTTKNGDASSREDTFTGIENVVGSQAIDVITGDTGANKLLGGTGADTINGGDGNDTLSGGDGVDSLTGGAGTDTVDYTLDSADSWGYGGQGISIDLATGRTVRNSDFTVIDYLSGIENAVGTNRWDALTGDANANVLYGWDGRDGLDGGAGNDTLYGGTGDDSIKGGADNDVISTGGGHDTVDGGAGTDTLNYSLDVNDGAATRNGAGLEIRLDWGTTQSRELGQFVTTFSGIENANGSDGNDVLVGDDIVNVLSGSDGNDFIRGSGGSDTLYGGDGDDTLSGGNDADFIFGGAGIDTFSLQADTIEASRADGLGYTVNLIVVDATLAGRSSVRTLNIIGDFIYEVENVLGSNNADNVNGSTAGNLLVGYGGDDTLAGDAGDDTLSGGAGADTLHGGAGIDTVDFSHDQADAAGRGGLGYAINLTANTATFRDNATSAATLSDFENAIGSNLADIITGTTGANRLEGRAGNDSLYGGQGNDTLAGGAGADYLEGSSGEDIADYSTSSAAISVNLGLFNAAGVAIGQGGDAQQDSLAGVDGLIGSAFNDTLTGFDAEDASATGFTNEIRGGGGNDSIDGRGGSDRLYGDDGHDTVQGGSGHDLIEGGAGRDVLYGDIGNDTIRGGDDLDVIYGGADNDLIDGGDGGGQLFGDAGNDTLVAGSGTDIIDGGADFDTLILGDRAIAGPNGEGWGVDVTLGYVLEGLQAVDTFTNIESIIGSRLNDTIAGGAGNDRFDGGSGNDSLIGGGGNDTLIAGASAGSTSAGVDVLVGGAGSDTFQIHVGSTSGLTTIDDFDLASDVIRLVGSGQSWSTQFILQNFRFVEATPDDAILQLDSDTRLILKATDLSLLAESHFQFV